MDSPNSGSGLYAPFRGRFAPIWERSTPLRGRSAPWGERSAPRDGRSVPGGSRPPRGVGPPPQGGNLSPRGTDCPRTGADAPVNGADRPRAGATIRPQGTDRPPLGTDRSQIGANCPPDCPCSQSSGSQGCRGLTGALPPNTMRNSTWVATGSSLTNVVRGRKGQGRPWGQAARPLLRDRCTYAMADSARAPSRARRRFRASS